MSREQLLAATFMELADTLGDDFSVLDFLQNLADRTTEILDATAAGLVLADQRGHLQQVASTNRAARMLGIIALGISRGPAEDAFHSGQPVLNVEAHRAAARWPRFTTAASDLGFCSVHAFPLRHGDEVLGALSLFFAEPTRLSSDDAFLGATLARVAAVGLLQERTPRQQELVAERLQRALTERVELERAKGVVAERACVTVELAFELLLTCSRVQRRRLSDVARGVLDGSVEVRHLLP